MVTHSYLPFWTLLRATFLWMLPRIMGRYGRVGAFHGPALQGGTVNAAFHTAALVALAQLPSSSSCRLPGG